VLEGISVFIIKEKKKASLLALELHQYEESILLPEAAQNRNIPLKK
jgi:hypothetical protein